MKKKKLIGVWYSILTVKTLVVKMGDGNKVIVNTPELNIYDDDDKGGTRRIFR